MNISIKKELPLIIIVLLPFIYLAYIWNDLPEKVPLHWNLEGEVNRYGNKIELLVIPFLLPLLIYIIFLVAPSIDPKKKIAQMGSKYNSIKVLLTVFMSILALFIIYTVKNESLTNPNIVLLFIGILYLILGNYFKTIKANYFIGIRTPWTLEDEIVWNDTHKMAGIMWFIGGIIVVLSSLILETKSNFTLFIAVTLIIAITPVAYSYIRFKQLKKTA